MPSVTRYPVCIAVLGVLLAATPSLAQFDTATVLGTVKDNTGGVVPGATVTLTNLDTGVSASRFPTRTAASSSSPCASAATRPARSSRASRSRWPRNPGAGRGQAKGRSVAVSGATDGDGGGHAAATRLETDSSQRGQVITGEQTRALPLNGREYSALALLSPRRPPVGAQPDGRRHAARRRVQRQRPAQHLQQLPASTASTTTPTAPATRASPTR